MGSGHIDTISSFFCLSLSPDVIILIENMDTTFFISRPGIVFFVEIFSLNTYSMKQPDVYYFETIKMTSQS